MVKPLSEQPLKHIETRTLVQNLLDEGKNLMAIAKNEIPFKPRHKLKELSNATRLIDITLKERESILMALFFKDVTH